HRALAVRSAQPRGTAVAEGVLLLRAVPQSYQLPSAMRPAGGNVARRPAVSRGARTLRVRIFDQVPVLMRFVFTILGRVVPPAFVLFLFVDTLVNPNIPRLGTVSASAGKEGELTPEESRALLDKSKKLLLAGKDKEALAP